MTTTKLNGTFLQSSTAPRATWRAPCCASRASQSRWSSTSTTRRRRTSWQDSSPARRSSSRRRTCRLPARETVSIPCTRSRNSCPWTAPAFKGRREGRRLFRHDRPAQLRQAWRAERLRARQRRLHPCEARRLHQAQAVLGRPRGGGRRRALPGDGQRVGSGSLVHQWKTREVGVGTSLPRRTRRGTAFASNSRWIASSGEERGARSEK